MPSRLERGLAVRWTLADGRPVRSLSAGVRQDRPELVLVPGLGALGYVVPTVHACASWTRVHLLSLAPDRPAALALLPPSLRARLSSGAGQSPV